MKTNELKKIETPYYTYYEYRGYCIDCGLYGQNSITVNYCGNDIHCQDLIAAMATIDEIIENEINDDDLVDSLDPDSLEYIAYYS